MSRRIKLVLGIVTLVSFVIAAYLWFTPSGAGERRLSPDRNYEASAFNMTVGKWNGTREYYTQIKVIEVESGRTLWNIIRGDQPGSDSPNYHFRDKRYIAWLPDSTGVSIPMPNHQTMTLPVSDSEPLKITTP